jgi:hypothetical protein
VALGCTRIADGQSDIQVAGGNAEMPAEIEYYEGRSYYWPALSMIILNQTLYRSFFTTKSGLIGLAPFTAQEGDMIYLLPRGDTPSILRPIKNNEFHLVGHAVCMGLCNAIF